MCTTIATCHDPPMTLVVPSGAAATAALLGAVRAGASAGSPGSEDVAETAVDFFARVCALDPKIRPVLNDLGLLAALEGGLTRSLDLVTGGGEGGAPKAEAGPGCSRRASGAALRCLSALCEMDGDMCHRVIADCPALMVALRAAAGAEGGGLAAAALAAVEALSFCGVFAEELAGFLPAAVRLASADPAADAAAVASGLDAARALCFEPSLAIEAKAAGLVGVAVRLAGGAGTVLRRKAMSCLAAVAGSDPLLRSDLLRAEGLMAAVAGGLSPSLSRRLASPRAGGAAGAPGSDGKDSPPASPSKGKPGARPGDAPSPERSASRGALLGSRAGSLKRARLLKAEDGDIVEWLGGAGGDADRAAVAEVCGVLVSAANLAQQLTQDPAGCRAAVQGEVHLALARLLLLPAARDADVHIPACHALGSMVARGGRAIALDLRDAGVVDTLQGLMGQTKGSRVTSERFAALFELHRALAGTRVKAVALAAVAVGCFAASEHFAPSWVVTLASSLLLVKASEILHLHAELLPAAAAASAGLVLVTMLPRVLARTAAVRWVVGGSLWGGLAAGLWTLRGSTAWNAVLSVLLGMVTLQVGVTAAVGARAGHIAAVSAAMLLEAVV